MYTEDLSYQSVGFQYAVVKALIEDPDFLTLINDILDQNTFTDPYIRQTVGVIRDYYKKYSVKPSYGEVSAMLRKKALKDDDIQYYEETISKVRAESEFSPDYVKAETTDFMKWKLVNALAGEIKEKFKRSWNDKDFRKIANRFNDIQYYGMTKGASSDLSDDQVMDTLSQGVEDIITTGIKEFDDIIGGGLPRGDVGLIVARTGAGKSTISTILAQNASLYGYKALQIYFEDEVEDITRKHIAKYTGAPIKKLINLTDEASRKLTDKLNAQEQWEQIRTNLRLHKMEVGETTVEDIENAIVQYANKEGYRPDVMLIDYFDCLKHSTNPTREAWEAQVRCMKKIKALAQKYKIAVWVMQQTNGLGMRNDAQGEYDEIQGGKAITQPCTDVIFILRNDEQFVNDEATIKFNKARRGKSGRKLENVEFNNSIVRIDCRDTKAYREEEMPDFSLHKNN